LFDDISDTVFAGYTNNTLNDCLFCAYIEDKNVLDTAIIDIPVLLKRLESKQAELIQLSANLTKEIDSDTLAMQNVDRITSPFISSNIASEKEKLTDSNAKLTRIANSKFGLVLVPELVPLIPKIQHEYEEIPKNILSPPLDIGDLSGIKIGDIEISFERHTLTI